MDMQQEEVVERIKAFAQRVLPEGSSLWLYGSRARGDAHPDSDYDLLLLLNTERITDEEYEHYVYDLFLERFPSVAPVISFEMFSMLVDEALEKMRHILETNLDIKAYVEGSDGE